MSARVLVVEDDATMAEVLAAYVLKAGYEVSRAGDGPTALAGWERFKPDVVVLDVMLPLLSGPTDRAWRETIEENVAAWWGTMQRQAMLDARPVNPMRIVWELSERLPPDAIVAAVIADGTCWLGATTWHDQRLIRISVSNATTTEADIDRSADAILAAAARVG